MIYLVFGEDRFRRQNHISKLKSQYLLPGMEDFNFLQLLKPNTQDLLSAVATPSWGMGEKLILIQDFKFLSEKCDDDKELDSLVQGLTNIPSGIVVVFEAKKINGTLKLVKKLKPLSNVCEFNPFSPWNINEAVDWLAEKQTGLDRELLEELVTYVGQEDSGALYGELQRLLALGKPIDSKLIREECSAKHDVFNFIRMLEQNNQARAIQELQKLLDNGEVPLKIIAVAQTMIGKTLRLKLGETQGLKPEDLAKLLGTSPGRIYHLKKESAKLDTLHLERVLNKLMLAEEQSKTGVLAGDLALRTMLYR